MRRERGRESDEEKRGKIWKTFVQRWNTIRPTDEAVCIRSHLIRIWSLPRCVLNDDDDGMTMLVSWALTHTHIRSEHHLWLPSGAINTTVKQHGLARRGCHQATITSAVKINTAILEIKVVILVLPFLPRSTTTLSWAPNQIDGRARGLVEW